MQNNFDRVLALSNCCRVSYNSLKSSVHYIKVWKRRCEFPTHQKESFEALINHQW